MNTTLTKSNRTANLVIAVLSVAIPLVVAFLLFLPQTGKLGDLDVSFLPHLNAVLNSGTAICLLAALMAVKFGNYSLHKALMLSALVLSTIFLLSYVLFHFQGSPTYYGDTNFDGKVDDAERLAAGGMRTLYVSILLAHIVLAVVVVPFVLFSFYYALSNQLNKHKKVVKFAFPLWLFVAVSGVVVYLMIRPYYSQKLTVPTAKIEYLDSKKIDAHETIS